MRVGTVDRIEASVQAGAAAAFAVAIGFAVSRGLAPAAHGVSLWLPAAAAAMLAYWLCGRALALVAPPQQRFRIPIPIFDLRPAVSVDADRHVDGGPSRSSPPDASQDLYAALAELRRELS